MDTRLNSIILHCCHHASPAHSPRDCTSSEQFQQSASFRQRHLPPRLREWLNAGVLEDGEGVRTLYIQPGSPWENGYVESFNGKLRDELLNGEIFYTLREAKVLIERWRQYYNQKRPHSSLGYRPPAPEAIAQPAGSAPLATLRPPAGHPSMSSVR